MARGDLHRAPFSVHDVVQVTVVPRSPGLAGIDALVHVPGIVGAEAARSAEWSRARDVLLRLAAGDGQSEQH